MPHALAEPARGDAQYSIASVAYEPHAPCPKIPLLPLSTPPLRSAEAPLDELSGLRAYPHPQRNHPVLRETTPSSERPPLLEQLGGQNPVSPSPYKSQTSKSRTANGGDSVPMRQNQLVSAHKKTKMSAHEPCTHNWHAPFFVGGI